MSLVQALSSLLLLGLAIFSAAATVNAFKPMRHTVALLPSMIWSWFVLGLAEQLLLAQILAAALLIAAGALLHWIGWVALVILIISWIGTGISMARAGRARGVVDRVLTDAGIERTTDIIPLWRRIVAVPMRPRNVHKTANIPFRRVAGRTLHLDVFTDDTDATGRPVFMYVHGGAWIMGSRREQGLPMVHHLAAAGWLCVSISYRLSPGAGWPDHLVDVKSAIAWVREHAVDYGGDPSFLVVAGGSAGGHLTAMAALTENLPRYQPGFEDADTSVQVAVSIYGIYDVTNRLGVQNKDFVSLLMEPMVIKAYLADEPEKFTDASPIDHIHSDVPPFVIAQGDIDTLAPVEEARAFRDALEAVSESDVVYIEFPGAQHVFDIGYSLQSCQLIEGVQSVLDHEYRRYRDRGDSSPS